MAKVIITIDVDKVLTPEDIKFLKVQIASTIATGFLGTGNQDIVISQKEYLKKVKGISKLKT